MLAALLTSVVPSPLPSQQVPTLLSFPYTVRFAPGGQRLAARVLTMASEMDSLPGLRDEWWRLEPIEIGLAPTEAAFQLLTGGQTPEWGAGVAIPSRSLIVLPAWGSLERGGPLDYGRVLRHELAHIALHRSMPSSPPRWFDEGYASWAAGELDRSSTWLLRLAFLTGSAPPLDSLSLDWPRGAAEARLAYLLSASVVDYLVDESGVYGLGRFLDRWKRGGDVERALIETYGVDTGALEAQWIRYVKKKYGWTVVVSQSAIFGVMASIIVATLFLIRRRRDRARRTSLSEEELPDTPAYWSEAGIEIIAHRGYSALAPENTVAAFELALEHGATALEFDLHSSFDGVPIVIHDATLERTTTGTGNVSRRKWTTLQMLDAGRWKAPEFSGEPLPSLEDLLRVVQGRASRLYIELKERAFKNTQLTRVLAEVERYGFSERSVVMSFDWLQLDEVRKQNPGITIAFLADQEDGYLDALERARAAGNALVDCNYKLLLANPDLARLARQIGVELVVYTVNDTTAAAALVKQGVRRLTTNEVGKFVRWAAGRDPDTP
ncbi:MAG: glycerophosphodiester phosphodiesterase family protein [Gemmatimonadota bacterium]